MCRYVTVKKKIYYHFASNDGQVHLEPKVSSLSRFQRVFASISKKPSNSDLMLQASADSGDDSLSFAVISEIDGHIASAKASGRVFDAYRQLVDRCRFNDELAPLPSVWRMCHSPVEEIEYLQHLNITIREFILDALGRNAGKVWNNKSRDRCTMMVESYACKARDLLLRPVNFSSELLRAYVTTELRKLWSVRALPWSA